MRCLVDGNPVHPDAIAKQSDQVKALFGQADSTKTKVEIKDIVKIFGNSKATDGKHTNSPARASSSYFR